VTSTQVAESAKQQADEATSRLALVYEVAGHLNSTLELHECLDRIIDGAYRVFRAEKVSLMLIGEGTDELRISAARNVPQEVIDRTRARLGEGLAGKVALTGEPLVVSDMEDDPRLHRKSKERYRTGSFAIVPLKYRGRVLGVINLTNRADGASFSERDLALLDALANQAAVAIENSRLVGQLHSDKEQLRRRAFESDTLYRLSSSIRYGLGYQHLIELLCSRLEGLLDCDVLCSLLVLQGDEEVDAHPFRELPEQLVRSAKRALVEDLASRPAGPLVSERLGALRKELGPADAGTAPPSVIAVPLEASGEALGMIHVAGFREDAFTAEEEALLHAIVRKMGETVERLQSTIRGEQDKMQSMVASMAEGVAMFDVHDKLVVINPKARSMLGVPADAELTTEGLFKAILWKDIAEFLR